MLLLTSHLFRGFADNLQDEKDRFDVYNDVLERIFLSTVFPNLEAGPREVLDCGFGTGAWISSLLDEHEDYEVSVRLVLRRSSAVTHLSISDHDVDDLLVLTGPRSPASTYSIIPATAMVFKSFIRSNGT